MSDSHILFEIQDTIATITLNRPEKLNAISLAMLDQIEAAVAQLENNRDVRVGDRHRRGRPRVQRRRGHQRVGAGDRR